MNQMKAGGGARKSESEMGILVEKRTSRSKRARSNASSSSTVKETKTKMTMMTMMMMMKMECCFWFEIGVETGMDSSNESGGVGSRLEGSRKASLHLHSLPQHFHSHLLQDCCYRCCCWKRSRGLGCNFGLGSDSGIGSGFEMSCDRGGRGSKDEDLTKRWCW